MTIPERKRIYKEYILLKMFEGDFHGVADAANDLRELEVEEKIRGELAPGFTSSGDALAAAMNACMTPEERIALVADLKKIREKS